MAIVTINSNSNYSAIKSSLASGDTIRIDTNTVRLTVDEQPLLTNITVDSPSVSGRMTVSGAYDLSTWAIIAGTVALIDGTFPVGATLGSATAGTGSAANAISINEGLVVLAIGGSGPQAYGIGTNNGTVNEARGGTGITARGINANNGLVLLAIGSATSGAHGVMNNFATVAQSNGGSVAGAHGVFLNQGSVLLAIGGSVVSAFGVNTTSGLALRLTDSIGRAIGVWNGSIAFVFGPDVAGTIASPITTIYSLGAMNLAATLPVGATVIELSEGSGGGFPLSRVLN
jgi:hypothetical protein